MGLMPVTDSMFMIPEDRHQPMHVGGLQVFEQPPDVDPEYLTRLYEEAIAVDDVAPLFRRRPHRSLATGYQWAWVEEDEVDLEHHVRHSALPRPGRVRELLALTSRLHGTLLDRSRPLWETHLIEGLEGGRFAVYTKQHHALMDGVSAMKLLQRSLSTDPDEATPMPYRRKAQPSRSGGDGSGRGGGLGDLLRLPLTATRLGASAATDAVGLTPRVLKLAAGLLQEQAATLPGEAPRSILNVPISGSRRFAGDSWSLDRIRTVAKGTDTTVNDVVLAMCSGALRAYLRERDALPSSSLVAMTPMSLRTGAEEGETGNAVGTILCHLGTDLPDAERRLRAVHHSMVSGKAALAGLSPLQVTALSAVVVAPLVLGRLGLAGMTRPPFNLVISNVPGPKQPLYWNGARLQGMYPLSIPVDGQALNITVTSYDGELQVGLTGCRRSVPHLQRMLGHLEDELTSLEAVAG